MSSFAVDSHRTNTNGNFVKTTNFSWNYRSQCNKVFTPDFVKKCNRTREEFLACNEL